MRNVKNLITTYEVLLANVASMSEDELKRAIEVEKEEQRRQSVLVKLHQAYTRKRARREREELLRS